MVKDEYNIGHLADLTKGLRFKGSQVLILGCPQQYEGFGPRSLKAIVYSIIKNAVVVETK